MLEGLTTTVGSSASSHVGSLALPMAITDASTGANIDVAVESQPMDKKKRNALINQAKNKSSLADSKIEEIQPLKDEITGNEKLYP